MKADSTTGHVTLCTVTPQSSLSSSAGKILTINLEKPYSDYFHYFHLHLQFVIMSIQLIQTETSETLSKQEAQHKRIQYDLPGKSTGAKTMPSGTLLTSMRLYCRVHPNDRKTSTFILSLIHFWEQKLGILSLDCVSLKMEFSLFLG